MMFDGISTAPSDPIFGLTEAFRRDTHPAKINLGAGVFRDERGRTPILAVVKEAERRIWQEENSKSYLAIEGDAGFTAHVQRLIFGKDHPLATGEGVVGVQTPGGTGALHLAAALLKTQRPDCTVWIPDPTWVNHAQICKAAGLQIRVFPYLDEARRRLNLERLTLTLSAAAPGDVVIGHGCCHNPSGIDPSIAQWRRLTELLRELGLVPLVDLAYLGFGQGVSEDRSGVLALADGLDEMMVCTSFSKNFALYNERVGALTLITSSESTASAVLSQIKALARVTWSNPPAHGAAIVRTVMESDEMYTQWRDELEAMRLRIVAMRHLFVQGLNDRGVALSSDGNEFLLDQHGMFSFLGLSAEQVERLRTEFSVYLVGSSRVNFASMTSASMKYLCDAMAQVA